MGMIRNEPDLKRRALKGTAILFTGYIISGMAIAYMTDRNSISNNYQIEEEEMAVEWVETTMVSQRAETTTLAP